VRAFGCLDSGRLRTSLDRVLYVLITVARVVMVVLRVVRDSLVRVLGPVVPWKQEVEDEGEMCQNTIAHS